jgi:hypothetical protein
MPRYFTLQEANQALNLIRPWMDEVQAIRLKVLKNQPEAWPAIEKSAGNGGNRALSNLVQANSSDSGDGCFDQRCQPGIAGFPGIEGWTRSLFLLAIW